MPDIIDHIAYMDNAKVTLDAKARIMPILSANFHFAGRDHTDEERAAFFGGWYAGRSHIHSMWSALYNRLSVRLRGIGPYA